VVRKWVVDLNSKVSTFIKKLKCSNSNEPEVEEWNVNDMHYFGS
jgi:hypothetical protein